MGYIRHDAIIVTAWDKKYLEPARGKAVELEMAVSEIISSPINGYESFFIAPDGSKEGWAESSKGDEQRSAWIAWAKASNLYFDWVAVNYGGDDAHRCLITDHCGHDDGEAHAN